MFSIFVILLLLPIYFVPWLIAAARRHDKLLMVFLINLAVGWTVIGWVACLAWALLGDTKSSAQQRQQLSTFRDLD